MVVREEISRVGRTWFGRLIDAGTLGHVFDEEVQYEAQVIVAAHAPMLDNRSGRLRSGLRRCLARVASAILDNSLLEEREDNASPVFI
jgi:hypothetical protein